MGEYAGAAPDAEAAEMLLETALHKPLPPAAPLATIHALVLPTLCVAHADRLPALGLLDSAIEAVERMVRHKDFVVKVAAVRSAARLMAWNAKGGSNEDMLSRVVPVMQTALAPDQDRALHAVRASICHACCSGLF
jgi:hypothetical protein